MYIKKTEKQKHDVYRLTGANLDRAACRLIADELHGIAKSCNEMILDLSELRFTDSAGLSLLRTLSANVDLVLLNVSQPLFLCLNRLPVDKLPLLFRKEDEFFVQRVQELPMGSSQTKSLTNPVSSNQAEPIQEIRPTLD